MSKPILRGKTWYLKRRVPARFASVEKRVVIWDSLSTNVDCHAGFTTWILTENDFCNKAMLGRQFRLLYMAPVYILSMNKNFQLSKQ